MKISTFTYGEIPVELWEYSAFLFLLVLILIWGYRTKLRNIHHNSSYRFFIPGLLLKIVGGVAFALIYTLYYGGGDTTNYYQTALAYVNLFQDDIPSFFQAYFGGGTAEVKSLFNHNTGYPLATYFFDDRTRAMTKILVPFMIISGKSYFIATLWISVFTYAGLWRLYQVFVGHFPQFQRNLAIGILFMPSVVFWGSGILKDSVTLAATCYFIEATNDFTLKKGSLFFKSFRIFVSSAVIILLKPYILIVLLPGTLIWFFYARIKKIKNRYFRSVIVPFTYVFILSSSYFLLTQLGDSFGKFAPEKALETAVVTQHDLKQEYYKGNSFDIGDFDASYTSLASKFPAAVTAGLYRPFIWESKNVVMLLSGIENFFILIMTVLVIVRIRWRLMWKLIADHPIILYSLIFAVLFAFMIGITTSNFGALVRFKIPLIPIYMASIMIMYSHLTSFRIKSGKQKYLWVK
ncbi:MAG: hypothetical protein ACPGED_03470 [Flavobacteriales bacterium]